MSPAGFSALVVTGSIFDNWDISISKQSCKM